MAYYLPPRVSSSLDRSMAPVLAKEIGMSKIRCLCSSIGSFSHLRLRFEDSSLTRSRVVDGVRPSADWSDVISRRFGHPYITIPMESRSGGSITERMVATSVAHRSFSVDLPSGFRIHSQRRLQVNGGAVMLGSITFVAIVMAFTMAVWVCCRIRQVPGQSPLRGGGLSPVLTLDAAFEPPGGRYEVPSRLTKAPRERERRERTWSKSIGTRSSRTQGLEPGCPAERGLRRGSEPRLPPAEVKAIAETDPVGGEDAGGDNSKACAICLDEYSDGDDVCFSYNRRCQHVFHRSCIIDWLMSDDTCPCCRQNFVAFQDVEVGQAGSTSVDLADGARIADDEATTAAASAANSQSRRFSASLLSSGWETVSHSSLFLGSSRHSSVGAMELGVECDPSSEHGVGARTVGR
jgi:Ring finger domain